MRRRRHVSCPPERAHPNLCGDKVTAEATANVALSEAIDVPRSPATGDLPVRPAIGARIEPV